MKTLKALSSLFAFLFFGITLSAQTHVVTTSDDYVTGSLRHRVTNSSANDTIVFDPSILANGSDTIKVDFPIIFNHGLTIKGLFLGGDTLYLSGQDSSRIFYMDFDGVSGVEMYLEDLAIIEGNQYVSDPTQDKDHGGAIMAYGLDVLHLENSLFRANRTKFKGAGGSIYFRSGGDITVSKSIFQDNVSTFGGAIRVGFSQQVVVLDSKFNNNHAEDFGGAISVYNGKLVVTGSRFEKNIADGQTGGAINYAGDSTMIVRESVFFDNSSEGFGGAIFYNGGLWPYGLNTFLEIAQCDFRNNQSDEGGALKVTDGGLQVHQSSFSRNKAKIEGGAISSDGLEIQISNSTFYDDFSPIGNEILTFEVDVIIENSTMVAGDSATNASLVKSFDQTGAYAFKPGGSIFCHKGGNIPITISSPWVNSGYNIYSNNPLYKVGTDLLNVSITNLDLESLHNNGGTTPTMIPSATSPALNAGDPTDFSDAQNSPIYGVRDIGAAERQTISADTTLICGPITWWGNTYSQAGTYTDSAYNAMGTLDSTGVLVLTEINDSATIKNPYIVALEQSVGTTYQWIDCNNPLVTLTGATDSIYQPTTNGTYAVIVSLDGCVDTSNCVVYNQVSLDENVLPEQWMTFYPNPTNGSITVKGLDKNSVPTSLVIMDLSGRPLHEMTINSERIQLPPLAEGMYLLKFRGDDGLVQVERVVFGQ